MTDPVPGSPPGRQAASAAPATDDADRDAVPAASPRRRSRLRRPLGLRGALAGFFVAITVVPLVSSVVLLGSQVDELLADRAERQLSGQAQAIAGMLTQRAARLDGLADDLARWLATEHPAALADNDTAALDAWLAASAGGDVVPRRADVVVVLDADGGLVAARGADAEVERLVAGAAHERGALTARRRIRADGAPAGVLGEVRVADRLDEDALADLGVDGAALLTADGDTVAAPTGSTPEPLPAPGAVTAAERDGRQVATIGVELGELRLVLWNGQPDRPAVLRSTLGVLVPAILLAATLGWALAAQVAAPIGRAAATARAIAAGDLDRRVSVGGPTESRELAEALNRMAGELQTRLAELHASRDALAGSLERIGRSLASSLDVNETLGVVVEAAMVTLGADGAVVYLVADGQLQPTVRAGTIPAELAAVELGQGLVGRVARSGSAERLPHGSLEPAPAEPEAGARLVVPLLGGAGVRGVLVVLRADIEAGFDGSDLETLRTFAAQAAVALENVDRHEEAARQAVTDPLTGLPNARFLGLQVGHEVATAERYGRGLALLVCDLDHFKEVNDTHGHDAGDTVLVEVAARFEAATRAPDVVARVGGEEFVVLLPTADLTGAATAAERLRAAIASPPIDLGLGRGTTTVTISIGGAARAPDEDADALRRRADEALYAAKRSGRNRWAFADAPSTDPRR